MPGETPRSKLIEDKARTFRILAKGSQGALDCVVLAAAYEALAVPAAQGAPEPAMRNDATA